MATLTAARNLLLPGAINLVAYMDLPYTPASIVRIDGSLPAQPVRNFDGNYAELLEPVVDPEAPLGRPVYYLLLDMYGGIMAQSAPVTARAPLDNRSLLRSVLRPSVMWMWVEPQDEKGVKWKSSTTVHEIPGSDTPVVVSEIRQRHTGTIIFLCKSIADADQLVMFLRDGTLMLLRHSPCAGVQTRDMLFYPRDVDETRYQRSGWRLVAVDFQTSKFVAGWTDEPPLGKGWDFGHLDAAAGDEVSLMHSAPDFATLTGMTPNFAVQSLLPFPPWPGRTAEDRARGIEEERERRRVKHQGGGS